eukprot:Opistho-1_new@100833
MACASEVPADFFSNVAHVDVSYLELLGDGFDMSAPGSPLPLYEACHGKEKFNVLTPPLSGCPSPAPVSNGVSLDSLFVADVDMQHGDAASTPARKAVKAEARDAMWNGVQLASEDDIDTLLTPLATPHGIAAFDFSDEEMAAACDFVEPAKFFPTYFVGDESKITADAPSAAAQPTKKSVLPPTPAQSPTKRAFAFDEEEDEDEEIDVVTVTESGKRKSPAQTLRQPPAKRQKTAAAAHIPMVPAKAPSVVSGVRVPVPAATSAAAMASVTRPRASSVASSIGMVKPAASPAPVVPVPSPVSDSMSAAAAAQAARQMDTEAKRNTHNVLERKRRNDLKSSFHQLREAIPELEDNERAPKVLILKKAGDYIAALRQKDAEVEALKERLRAEGRMLQERLRGVRA